MFDNGRKMFGLCSKFDRILRYSLFSEAICETNERMKWKWKISELPNVENFFLYVMSHKKIAYYTYRKTSKRLNWHNFHSTIQIGTYISIPSFFLFFISKIYAADLFLEIILNRKRLIVQDIEVHSCVRLNIISP